MVVPGFQDVHIHPISGGIEANGCDLNAVTTVEGYVADDQEVRRGAPERSLDHGRRLVDVGLRPGRARAQGTDRRRRAGPAGHPLTAATAIRPGSTARRSRSPASRRTRRIRRTGASIAIRRRAKRSAASRKARASLVKAKVPPDIRRASATPGLRYAVKMLNGYGITGIQDAASTRTTSRPITASMTRARFRCTSSARSGGSATRASSRSRTSSGCAANTRAGRIDAGTVKIMQDGVMENYTAVVLEPYKLPGKKDVRGIPMVEPELLKKAVTQLDADGFQVPFPRDRRRRGAPGARCDRGGAHGERRPRPPPPHLAHPADPPGRPAALPQARRHRELPAALGLRG